MKAIMISIKPKYVADILNGRKTIEIRKTIPKCDLPIDVYIYCTKDKKYANLINRGGFLTGMVVAKFTLNNVEELTFLEGLYSILDRGYCTDTLDNAQVEIKSCVPQEKIIDYLYSKGKGYAWHIDNLVIFDKPKEIGGFYNKRERLFVNNKMLYDHKFYLTCAPQSWCYVEI